MDQNGKTAACHLFCGGLRRALSDGRGDGPGAQHGRQHLGVCQHPDVLPCRRRDAGAAHHPPGRQAPAPPLFRRLSRPHGGDGGHLPDHLHAAGAGTDALQLRHHSGQPRVPCALFCGRQGPPHRRRPAPWRRRRRQGHRAHGAAGPGFVSGALCHPHRRLQAGRPLRHPGGHGLYHRLALSGHQSGCPAAEFLSGLHPLLGRGIRLARLFATAAAKAVRPPAGRAGAGRFVGGVAPAAEHLFLQPQHLAAEPCQPDRALRVPGGLLRLCPAQDPHRVGAGGAALSEQQSHRRVCRHHLRHREPGHRLGRRGGGRRAAGGALSAQPCQPLLERAAALPAAGHSRGARGPRRPL